MSCSFFHSSLSSSILHSVFSSLLSQFLIPEIYESSCSSSSLAFNEQLKLQFPSDNHNTCRTADSFCVYVYMYMDVCVCLLSLDIKLYYPHTKWNIKQHFITGKSILSHIYYLISLKLVSFVLHCVVGQLCFILLHIVTFYVYASSIIYMIRYTDIKAS